MRKARRKTLRWAQAGAVFLTVSLGLWSAMAGSAREVRCDRTAVGALQELGTREKQLERMKAETKAFEDLLRADTAVIMSELKARYQIAQDEQIVGAQVTAEKCVLVVVSGGPAPVSTAQPSGTR